MKIDLELPASVDLQGYQRTQSLKQQWDSAFTGQQIAQHSPPVEQETGSAAMRDVETPEWAGHRYGSLPLEPQCNDKPAPISPQPTPSVRGGHSLTGVGRETARLLELPPVVQSVIKNVRQMSNSLSLAAKTTVLQTPQELQQQGVLLLPDEQGVKLFLPKNFERTVGVSDLQVMREFLQEHGISLNKVFIAGELVLGERKQASGHDGLINRLV